MGDDRRAGFRAEPPLDEVRNGELVQTLGSLRSALERRRSPEHVGAPPQPPDLELTVRAARDVARDNRIVGAQRQRDESLRGRTGHGLPPGSGLRHRLGGTDNGWRNARAWFTGLPP